MSSQLIRRVRSELGLPDSVSTDIDGLRTIYAAWCNGMTFDNIRKMIALRDGSQNLPGGDATDYFENWLANRSGGTCWPSSNALFTLISSYGFDARRVAASMFDLPRINHGSVKVCIDGADWLVDSSMLTCEPLPLTTTLYVRSNGPVRVEVEPNDAGYLIWADFPPHPEFVPCRLREDPVDLDYYRERYDASREISPFNERLYLRRIAGNGLVIFLGNTMFRRVADGLDVQPLSRNELCAAIHEIGGVSESLVSNWIKAGGLDATMNFSADAPQPPACGPRPSRR